MREILPFIMLWSHGVCLSPPRSDSVRRTSARMSNIYGCQELPSYSDDNVPNNLYSRSPRARRRSVLKALSCFFSMLSLQAVPYSTAALESEKLVSRLSADILKKPSVAPSAVDPLLPAWLAGRWQIEQTLVSFSTPLGVKFIGAPGQPLSDAEKSAAETRAQLGKPVRFELRFLRFGEGCREDRAFNAQQRIDGFAGRSVVERAASCDEAGVDVGNGVAACSFLDFKTGGVSQKIFVNNARLETPTSDAVVIDEIQRIILGRRPSYDILTDRTRTFPPITTDQENVILLRRSTVEDGSEIVNGRLRLASYLQPLDPLYFDSGGQAVSISDYRLKLVQISDDKPS